MNLKGKTIAITGGAGGIGSKLASQAAERGATPIIIDRVALPDFPWHYIQGDLSSMEGVLTIGQQLAGAQPDIMVNLAGIQHFGMLEMQSPEQVALMAQVNLVAPILLTQTVLPAMKKRKSGQIVNIGSIFGSIAFAHFVTYSATKAGIKAFSESLRRELADSGITVTHIAPRAVRTPLNSEKILQLAARTNMAMDVPELVAKRMIEAIESDAKDVYIGFPESLFVRINALLPRIVDGALAKNDCIAKEILTA